MVQLTGWVCLIIWHSCNFPDNPQCSVHLINRGLTIVGNNATLEWEGTGPSATTVVSVFACRLDRNAGGVYMPCKMLIVCVCVCVCRGGGGIFWVCCNYGCPQGSNILTSCTLTLQLFQPMFHFHCTLQFTLPHLFHSSIGTLNIYRNLPLIASYSSIVKVNLILYTRKFFYLKLVSQDRQKLFSQNTACSSRHLVPGTRKIFVVWL